MYVLPTPYGINSLSLDTGRYISPTPCELDIVMSLVIRIYCSCNYKNLRIFFLNVLLILNVNYPRCLK